MDDEFVEIDIDLDDIRRKHGPYWADKMWHQFRYSREYHTMTFDDWMQDYMVSAIESEIWLRSPKMIVAGTDGSIRIELLQ